MVIRLVVLNVLEILMINFEIRIGGASVFACPMISNWSTSQFGNHRAGKTELQIFSLSAGTGIRKHLLRSGS